MQKKNIQIGYQSQILNESAEEGSVTVAESHEDLPQRSLFISAVVKNAPNLISGIPIVGGMAAASIQAVIGTALDYYDGIANEKRLREMQSFDRELDSRLKGLEIKDEAKEYWEDTIMFHREEIMRKLLTEPGKGFDILLAEYVASALSDLSYPPSAKDIILSTLLSLDAIDVKVLRQLDTQFRGLVESGESRGVSFDDLVTLMKSGGIDTMMISRSLERLQAQDLIFSMGSNTSVLQELQTQQDLLGGEKGPHHYSKKGFGVSAFGRRFLRFLKLSD